MNKNLGKFDHHPDPAVDFCVEVEALEGEVFNHSIGFMSGTPSRLEVRERITRAMDFRVGGDLQAIAAKQTIRQLDAQFALSTPTSQP